MLRNGLARGSMLICAPCIANRTASILQFSSLSAVNTVGIEYCIRKSIVAPHLSACSQLIDWSIVRWMTTIDGFARWWQMFTSASRSTSSNCDLSLMEPFDSISEANSAITPSLQYRTKPNISETDHISLVKLMPYPDGLPSPIACIPLPWHVR